MSTSTRRPTVPKQLEVSTLASEFSRTWFSEFRRQVMDDRQPYVLAQAEMPHEIFEALGMPVVTNEWWSGVIAAKQMGGRYLDWINAKGFHKGLGVYSALALISLIADVADPPWGGLPKPAMIAGRHREQSVERLNAMVSAHFGVPYFGIEMPSAGRFYPNWWEMARYDWEDLYDTPRIDLLLGQYREMVAVAERVSGNKLDIDALRDRLERVNEQEEYFYQAREIIAKAPRCPVRIAEQMSNTMTAQWHRGSPWGVSHARAFRDEVAARATSGASVIPDERVRLMWGGVGLWQNTAFYSAFEESHGAVFVWSIYMALAADAYPKYGLSDPLRALAARYLHLGELAHCAPWAGAWMVHEARQARIDGCVIIAPPNQPHQLAGSVFQKEALEAAGIPVLVLNVEPNDNRTWDEEVMRARVSRFIEERLKK